MERKKYPPDLLEDRINECFVRSEAGKPLPTDSEQMTELIASLNWISSGVPTDEKLPWRGDVYSSKNASIYQI